MRLVGRCLILTFPWVLTRLADEPDPTAPTHQYMNIHVSVNEPGLTVRTQVYMHIHVTVNEPYLAQQLCAYAPTRALR